MPSAYMQYAKDGDNDGKADLWNSVPDALTSAANFLQNLGWVSGYRWGREVTSPANFQYQYSGKDQAVSPHILGRTRLNENQRQQSRQLM